MSQSNFYKVYITCLYKAPDGMLTRDYMLAKLLYRKLEQKGIHAFMMGRCNPNDRTEAIDSASVLIVAGTSSETLLSDDVCRDYEDFIAGVELSGKRNWRVFTYLRGLNRDELPDYLSAHRSYDYLDTDELVWKIQSTLEKEEPKNCVSDDYDALQEESFGDFSDFLPEGLPDCAESVREYDDDDYTPMRRPRRARRAPETAPASDDDLEILENRIEEKKESWLEPEHYDPTPFVPPVPPMRSMPSSVKKVKPQKVIPAKVSKVEFSVVAPDEVRPGKRSVVDLLMYTKSQRSIVKRTIDQAKEKSSEAARSSGSVSVKHGSGVTAQLFSDDIEITDGSRTMIWNGDALDFKFRVMPPEEYSKKEIDFGCVVQFDGIEITRLYFTVPVGSKKKVAVRFVRKDCRRAFVSYSHKDKLRVVEQLLAIQEVAPKLRFWMDNRSMSAGDEWRKAIASAIRSADVFLLFWSVSAKASSEVRKEWEYALRLEQDDKRGKNGVRFISPVPLESPSDCPPPKELEDLHFGDPSFDSDAADIEKVKVWAVKGKNIKYL